MSYFVSPPGTPSHKSVLTAMSNAGPIGGGLSIVWWQDSALNVLKSGNTSDPTMLSINTGLPGDVVLDATDSGSLINVVINGVTGTPVMLSNVLPTVTGGPVTDAFNRTLGRPTFNWTYSDADGDPQFYFKLKIGSIPGGTDFLNVKVFSAVQTFSFPIGSPAMPPGTLYFWEIDVTDGQKATPTDPDVPEPIRVEVSTSGSSRVNLPPQSSGVLIAGATGGATITPKRPIISWAYSDTDGQPQTKYRVIVVPTADPLAAPFWDSGVVTGSDSSAQYNFDGTGVAWPSHAPVYAGVQVFDTLEGSAFSFASVVVSNKPVVTEVAVDDGINPTNVTSQSPRFTWHYFDPDGDLLAGYELRISTQNANWGTDSFIAEVWNTGHVVTPEAYEAQFNFDGRAFPGCYNPKQLLASGGQTTRDFPTTYYFQLQVYDAFDKSDWATGYFKMNTPPVAQNLSIVPAVPFRNQDLVGQYQYVDEEPQSSLTQIRWYKNNAEIQSVRDALTVPGRLTAPGDVWFFTVKPHDGTDYGVTARSPSVTVLNLPPQATALAIVPSTPRTADDLQAVFAVSDPDGDSTQVTIRWYQNGQEVVQLRNSKVVPALFTVIGDSWYFTVLPTDGFDTGSLATSPSVKIVNTPPKVLSVEVENRILPPNVKSPNPSFSWTYQDDDAQPQDRYQFVIGTQPLRTRGIGTNADSRLVCASGPDGVISTSDSSGVVVAGNDVFDSGVVESSASNFQYATPDFVPPVTMGAGDFEPSDTYVVAPDGQTIRLSPGSDNGAVAGGFIGSGGIYDVVLLYHLGQQRSSYKVLIDGVALGQFTSQTGTGLAEHTFSSARIKPGALIVVTGSAADSGALAPFSRLMFNPVLQEDVAAGDFPSLSGYVKDGSGIKLVGLAGSASTRFGFPSGAYDIELQYVTETAGNPNLSLAINATPVLSFAYESGAATRSRFVKGVAINAGDTVRIMGTRNGGAVARVSRVIFRPTSTVQVGSRLREGFTYFASVRVNDGIDWSDWSTTRFAMAGSAWAADVSNEVGWTIEAKFRVLPQKGS